MSVAIIPQKCVCFCPWLIFSFSLSFFLSFSVSVPARPFLFNSILLSPKHSECYSEKMCLHRRTHLESSMPCKRTCFRRNFTSRQHCRPSLQSVTKGNLSYFWIFDRGSSGNEQNDSLNVRLDRYKDDHKKRPWQTLTEKSDWTLTVFLTKIYINIRCYRHG